MKIYICLCFIIICGCFFLSSCEDLTPKSESYISDNDFPKNDVEINSYLTGLYSHINRGAYGGGFCGIATASRWCLEEATTDEFYSKWNGIWFTYEHFLWTVNPNDDALTTNWTFKQDMRTISQCILGLYFLDRIKNNLSIDKFNLYRAQMATIIAMFVYSVYDLHGPQAIVEDPQILLNSGTMYNPERFTKEQMAALIRKYAQIGIDHLPVNYSKDDWGRVTKGTALMIMLKLAMHDQDWNAAKDYSQQIINLGEYKLLDHYSDVFDMNHKQNKEIILAGPMSVSDVNAHNTWLANVLPDKYVDPNGYKPLAWNGYCVPWNMYEKYWDKAENTKPYTPISDERLRLIWDSLTISDGHQGIKKIALRDSIDSKNWQWVKFGAIPYKYPCDPQVSGEACGNDWIIFRYADVLLLRAEALARLGDNAEAITLLNQIRKRAKTKEVSASDFPNTKSLLDFILDERFRELFMEGVRREDLIRYRDDQGESYYIREAKKRDGVHTDASREVYPIPQYAVNQGAQQNPGY